MTDRELMQQALEAFGDEHELFWMHGTDEHLERFAALVSAAEREACATICEKDVSIHGWAQARIAASAIRARGD